MKGRFKEVKDGIARGRFKVRLSPATVGVWCLCAGVWALPGLCSASDLFVGNFFGDDSDVIRYDASTGAFKNIFVPNNSGGLTFPLGAAFGADGNLYVSNSNNDTV